MSGSGYPVEYGTPASSSAPANLGDILERVLDKGLVVAGDIRINLLDIELLTVKLRLVIASLETAREVGIDWWEHDPWLRGRDVDRHRDLEAENRELRRRLAALESGGERQALETGHAQGDETGEQPRRETRTREARHHD
jgi:hypothetical protein